MVNSGAELADRPVRIPARPVQWREHPARLDGAAAAALLVRIAAKRGVDVPMGDAIRDLQIPDGVIQLVVVTMMDNLVVTEGAAKMGLHYKAMFQCSLSANCAASVAAFIGDSALPVRGPRPDTGALGARLRTVARARLAGVSRESLVAPLAMVFHSNLSLLQATCQSQGGRSAIQLWL